jgi:hypothetical protein
MVQIEGQVSVLVRVLESLPGHAALRAVPMRGIAREFSGLRVPYDVLFNASPFTGEA